MNKTEKPRHHNFYILNVKLRKRATKEDMSADDYVRLLKNAYSKKIHKESSKGKHCIFKFMFEEKDKKGKILYLHGILAQFTYITNEKWFNIESLDIETEFHVQDGLFPNAVFTEYVFIPAAHRFVFRTASGLPISPYPVKHFLEHALDEASKHDELVQVDVESSKETIEEILSATEIRKIMIDVNYSNFDNNDDIQKFFEEDVKSSNIERVKIEATRKPDESIDVIKSQILYGALKTSVSNGETTARILDKNGKAKTVKTSQFPRRESVFGTFTNFSDLVHDKIMKLFRNNGN